MKQENCQIFSMVMLRVLIGWHLLYEGLVKIIDPTWSASYYLTNVEGPLKSIFSGIPSIPFAIEAVNIINQWSLVFIGLSLILGLFSKVSSVSGALLLFMYYISNPPFVGVKELPYTEGNYLIVNKNLIEMAALLVLYFFPTGRIIGFDRFIKKNRK
ncbi:MAG: DoxX subfamily [Bacteroidales bacterium]|nr:DoxX subfamily [Bacteroidales bacterium]